MLVKYTSLTMTVVQFSIIFSELADPTRRAINARLAG